MPKQMYIIFLGMILSISFVHSKSFISDEREDGDQHEISFTNSQRQLQQEMLHAHNTYRTNHCAPPLRLDDHLSRSAQSYAEQLAITNGMGQGDTGGAGQNIFIKSSTSYLGPIDGTEPIIAWYKGVRYYDFNQGGFSMETGSFTQLVWVNSRQLGIGIAYTNDGYSAYIVAQYLPPGNYGNEYQENVLPAQC